MRNGGLFDFPRRYRALRGLCEGLQVDQLFLLALRLNVRHKAVTGQLLVSLHALGGQGHVAFGELGLGFGLRGFTFQGAKVVGESLLALASLQLAQAAF